MLTAAMLLPGTRERHKQKQRQGDKHIMLGVHTKTEEAEQSLIEEILGPDERKDTWRGDALCAQTDPEAFFPDKGGSTRDAKRICAQCAVRQKCLEWAVDHDERFGIWGGMSERERRRYKKERRA